MKIIKQNQTKLRSKCLLFKTYYVLENTQNFSIRFDEEDEFFRTKNNEIAKDKFIQNTLAIFLHPICVLFKNKKKIVDFFPSKKRDMT